LAKATSNQANPDFKTTTLPIMAQLPADFDWRGSRLHIWYLGRFHKPSDTGKPSERSNLEQYIKEPVQSAIERFIRDGALEECSLEAKVGHTLPVPEIKDILRRHGQKTSGNKSELAAVVVQVAKEEAEKKLEEVKLYKCTSLGLEAVENFKVKSQEAKARAQEARALAQKESDTKLLASDPKIDMIDSAEDQVSGESLDTPPENSVEKLRQLKQLLDEGLIDNDEYQKKRAEILARI
jgi:hypothetical protein